MPTLKSYITGFVLSVLLTLAAYFPVLAHVQSHHQKFSHESLIFIVLVLAVVQLVVQLTMFLHLGAGKESRVNWFILINTVIIVLIVVIGSIWIMDHLNYNMTPQQVNNYLTNSDAF